jgi:hypothetical protein
MVSISAAISDRWQYKCQDQKLESVIGTVFHRYYRGGLVKWIQDYEDAFTELTLLGQKTWNDDENQEALVCTECLKYWFG